MDGRDELTYTWDGDAGEGVVGEKELALNSSISLVLSTAEGSGRAEQAGQEASMGRRLSRVPRLVYRQGVQYQAGMRLFISTSAQLNDRTPLSPFFTTVGVRCT